MQPSGAHTHPDGGGGIGAALAVVLGAVVVAAVAMPVLHALAELLRLVLIAAAVITGTGITAGVVFLTWRLRQPRPAPYSVRVLPRTQPARPHLAGREPAALGRPAEVHLHLHGLSAGEVAQALARHTSGPTFPVQPSRDGGPDDRP